ncbi:hypothetical protein N7449_007885 [Penicillium cf. viridicatum]|uniref:Zn(2)-C6 fungal-type domain-containing protein n=1 Tax=Penicillium cf. viridicatum TaxID=2972119 RepID=A0A9W9JJW3_9EURO|nr:hypothetical protein N7449_007885 [Penicillium cf. viridicatum]
MAESVSTSSSHNSHFEKVRKRVCKACDRCRLKKSKCDGATPCSRCRADNSICIFGKRKKTHEKVYPKGYVEKLEQQQVWLVHGLQALYHCITKGEGWPGDPLNIEPNGYPLTHDLLTRLGILDHFLGERFEENPEILQNGLWRDYLQCRESSVGSYEGEQSPLIRLHFSPNASSQQTMSPTSPAYNSPANKAQVKEEPMLATAQHTISSVQSIQGVINPLALQGRSAQWQVSSDFNIFDEMDMMNTADYSILIFDEP